MLEQSRARFGPIFTVKIAYEGNWVLLADPELVKGMKPWKRRGNWIPEGIAERVALRRDYTSLTPSQRVEQVFELSRAISQLAEAGRRQRGV